MKLANDSYSKKGLLLVGTSLLAACSLGESSPGGSGSSSAGDGGKAGAPCKNVAICTLITQEQVNSTLGVKASSTVPDEPINMSGLTSDRCAYLNAPADTNIQLLRQCLTDASALPLKYQDERQAYLAPGGARADLSGVGEKAFYETVPGQTAMKVRLVAFKGNVYVVVSDAHVNPGQDEMVKQGLISFAQTLLTAK